MNLSAVVVLLALAIWGSIWGIAGAFLAAPMTVMLMIVLAQFPTTRWIAILLSEDGKPTPDAERVIAGVSSVMAAEQDSRMDEYAFQWQPTTTVHVVHRAILLRDESGQPARVAHILQNATARHNATEQLVAERDELESRVAERTRPSSSTVWL